MLRTDQILASDRQTYLQSGLKSCILQLKIKNGGAGMLKKDISKVGGMIEMHNIYPCTCPIASSSDLGSAAFSITDCTN